MCKRNCPDFYFLIFFIEASMDITAVEENLPPEK